MVLVTAALGHPRHRVGLPEGAVASVAHLSPPVGAQALQVKGERESAPKGRFPGTSHEASAQPDAIAYWDSTQSCVTKEF